MNNITYIVEVKAISGHIADVKKSLLEVGESAVKFEGNVEFKIAQCKDKRHIFYTLESWKTEKEHQDFLNSEVVANYKREVENKVEDMEFNKAQRIF